MLDIALNSVTNATTVEDSEESAATVPLPGIPLEFGDDRDRVGLDRQPPALGEHTREILLDCNYSPNVIAELIDIGAAV